MPVPTGSSKAGSRFNRKESGNPLIMSVMAAEGGTVMSNVFWTSLYSYGKALTGLNSVETLEGDQVSRWLLQTRS